MESARAEMLRLVNQAREENGVGPVKPARSPAPQLHAEECARMGVGSHWNQEGLKPYMRASLANECQATAENVFSFRTNAGRRHDTMFLVREGMKGLMNSPGHRRNILNQDHRLLTTGLALHQGTFIGVQQFDGDFLRLAGPPRLTRGVIDLQITLLPPATAAQPGDLQLAINYDPPPQRLQAGQLLRVNLLPGSRLLLVDRPAHRQLLTEATAQVTRRIVREPAEIPADARMPKSIREWEQIAKRAYEEAALNREEPRVVPWNEGQVLVSPASQAQVQADLASLLRRHGAGVYTIEIWAAAHDRREKMLAGQHSLFVAEADIP